MSERATAQAAGYLRDGAAIYRQSFAIIRAEADLSRFTPEEADIAIRMIHACGQVEVAQHIVFAGNLVAAARDALTAGAPILCDSEMVARGIIRARLPAGNEVICTLNDRQCADGAVPTARTIGSGRAETSSDCRHSGWLCRRRGIKGSARRQCAWRAVFNRARPHRRQRHDRCRH